MLSVPNHTEMQIKVRFCLTPIRMVIIKKTKGPKADMGVETMDLIHC
jgi:hypothetical protein